MSRVCIVFLLIFLLSACFPSYPTTWQLVYHHDKSGRSLEGSKAQLIKAVKQGKSVRIVWKIRENFIHVHDAGFLTIIDEELFAQSDAIIRQIPEKTDIALDAENQSHWHAIFSTTGKVRTFQSLEKKLHDYNFEISWFVM